MPELEEVGERATGQVSRSQNLVYTLPHTTESIAEFLTPALARIDPSAGGTQVVVVTRDAETALTISETILRVAGPAGIEVVPVTSAARAGRIFKSRPVLAVAGTASELVSLVGSSLLKLDSVRTVVLAWVDDIIDDADLRRGRLAVHSRWGNDITVLLGDYLYIKSMALALTHDNLDLVRVLGEHACDRGPDDTTPEERHLEGLLRRHLLAVTHTCSSRPRGAVSWSGPW